MEISEDNILRFINADYETILSEIEITKSELMPEWTDDSDTDFGNLILTYVAMLADILSWKIDYSINECIPMLSKTIKAMYEHCKWIGYKPTSNKAAVATFQITLTNNKKPLSIPKGFKVTMENMVDGDYVIYELDSSVDCTAPSELEEGETYTVECTGTQGESVSEMIGISDGLVDQEFFITFSPYIEGSLKVEAYDSEKDISEYYKLNLNNSFVGAESNEPVIVIEQVDSVLIKVKFGDGYNGKIPQNGIQLIAHYRIGGGKVGNRPANVINVAVDEFPENVISITNITEAEGGEDAQNVNEIKEAIKNGAGEIVYTLMREVDYKNFLNKHSEIEKYAVCKSPANSSLTNSCIWIYIKPYNSFAFDSSYKSELMEEIDTFKCLTDIIEIKDCEIVNVVIGVEFMTDGLTDEKSLKNSAIYAIKKYIELLKVGSNDYNNKVGLYAENIKDEIKKIPGLIGRTVKITRLNVKSEEENGSDETTTGLINDIILTMGQVFNIENYETDIEITVT